MKQSKTYQRKIKQLLKEMPKSGKSAPPGEGNLVRCAIEGILQADWTAKKASRTLAAIEKEFVDFNELRISPLRDVLECFSDNCPDAADKINMIQKALGVMFAETNTVSMDYLAQTPPRELRRLLAEMGLNEYASGWVILKGLGQHAIPVDRDLAESLEMEGCVHPGSDLRTIQSFLERLVPKKMASNAHTFFRQFVKKHAKAIAKKRKAEAKVQAEIEAKARAKAQAKAEAEALERAAAEEKAAKAKKRAKKAVKKNAKKATKKKTAGKTKPETAKKAAKKSARETIAKTTRSASKKAVKTTKKNASKTTEKSAKKTSKKTFPKTTVVKKSAHAK